MASFVCLTQHRRLCRCCEPCCAIAVFGREDQLMRHMIREPVATIVWATGFRPTYHTILNMPPEEEDKQPVRCVLLTAASYLSTL